MKADRRFRFPGWLALSGPLSVFFLIALAGGLFAQPQRDPVCGAPRLHPRQLRLLRDFGAAGWIRAEKENRGTILRDTLGQMVNFWAFDFNYSSDDPAGYYSTQATCQDVFSLGNGYNLNLYVENSQLSNPDISPVVIAGIRNEFINTILPAETTFFGTSPTGDFTVLILDIPDSGGSSFISGYFDSTNEFGTTPSNHSNQRHMLFMDSSPGIPGSNAFYRTLAHEYQHFIHYFKDQDEDTWVNEGLSGLAGFVCGYGHQNSHVTSFANSPDTSLVIWGGDLAGYGATYLFMLYLAEHYGGSVTTQNIVANTTNGITGINSGLVQSGYSTTVNDIFKNWVVANYLNDPSVGGGIYAYTDSFSGIFSAPGNFQDTHSHTTYPASGSGAVNPYAVNYIKFSNLGGSYDIFILVPYSLSPSDTQFYTYDGRLGSFLLSLTGINSPMGASGIQRGSLNPTPQVLTTLSGENTINTGGEGGGGGGDGGGGCFIAAVAYGSELAPEVSTLRAFRNQYLLTNRPGRAFVSLYYALSPPLAQFISRHKGLQTMARIGLYPLVALAKGLMKTSYGTDIAF